MVQIFPPCLHPSQSQLCCLVRKHLASSSCVHQVSRCFQMPLQAFEGLPPAPQWIRTPSPSARRLRSADSVYLFQGSQPFGRWRPGLVGYCGPRGMWSSEECYQGGQSEQILLVCSDAETSTQKEWSGPEVFIKFGEESLHTPGEDYIVLMGYWFNLAILSLSSWK